MAPRLDVVGLVVQDMTASIAFYRRLGFQFVDGAEAEGWTRPSGDHRIALAFACDSPAEVDALYRQLVDAGNEGHFEPWDAFWGQRYATVHDPDGNAIELFAPLET